MLKTQIRALAVFSVLCGGAGLLPSALDVGSAHAAAAAGISVQADVQTSAKAEAALGDKLYAAGDYVGALAAYGDGFVKTKDAAFLYAEGACQQALKHKGEAEALFKMYLSSGAEASLKYANEAKAALGTLKSAGSAVIGGLTGAVTGTVGAVGSVAGKVVSGLFSGLKVAIAGEIDAAAKVKAQAGDAAYAAKNFAEAAKAYGEAYATSEPSVALFAQGSAEAQAGHSVEARALLGGYLAAEPKGKHADEAKQLLLAIGGMGAEIPQLAVKAKAAAEAKAEATKADAEAKAGRFLSAAKEYGAAYAKKAEPALLYAQGMAELSAGKVAEAKQHLSAYLKAGGKLEFKASAEAALKASGGGA